MAELRTPECVGYRVNAKEKEKGKRIEDKKQNNDTKFLSGQLTVYAERRNESKALGEYGGDAYPIVYEETGKDGKLKYGVILVADGVGQGAYTHPTLQKYLDARMPADDKPKDVDRPKRERLSIFLRTLYGDEIFSDKNEDVLAYALRSFADVPADGYFVASPEKWGKEENQQIKLPFYERDSQSLASRLVCVGLFLKFRDYFSDKKLDLASAEALRTEIENYIEGELKSNVEKMFDPNEDAPNTDMRDRYFLPCTVAAWFYIYDTETSKIHALALNCGDARCYLVDTLDGVRQISVDDAFPNGNMSAFVHFGLHPLEDDGYHDRKFRARLVRAKGPCALIACSDGVYDTCPFEADEAVLRGKYSLPYGETHDASDFLFEVNLLDALRRCYSFDDFSREIVFNFYAQANARAFAEYGEAGGFLGVKRDDSATLGARFIGETYNNSIVLFRRLRENQATTLDLLREKLETVAKESKMKIPYTLPHVESSEEKEEELWVEYAMGGDFFGVVSALKNLYSAAYESMKEAGGSLLWGYDYSAFDKPLEGWSLTQHFKKPSLRVAMLKLAVEDWLSYDHEADEFSLPEGWTQHEHVIIEKDILATLKAINFGEWVSVLKKGVSDPDAELKLKLYAHFELCFFGALKEDPHELIAEHEGLRTPSEEEAGDYALLLEKFILSAPVGHENDDTPAESCDEEPSEDDAPVQAVAEEKAEDVAPEAAESGDEPAAEAEEPSEEAPEVEVAEEAAEATEEINLPLSEDKQPKADDKKQDDQED